MDDQEAKRSLGLDLGSNSLGWAVVEDDKIISTGVLTFPEGMEEGKGALESPAAIRRGKRQTRRQIFRRKLRKQSVLRILIEADMCPMSMTSLQMWQREHRYPVEDEAFMDWLSSSPESNPYLCRKFAVEEKISDYDLGRAIYHLSQRRGFKSSRKDTTTNDDETNAKKKDTSTDDKDLGKVKQAIADMASTLDQRNQTLGQYFYDCFEGLTKNEIGFDRIRGRYLGRKEHYEIEFERIADYQEIEISLRGKLSHALFDQRPLRSQKHLVGKCSLEKKRTRCLIAHPDFERFRMLQIINNIRKIEQNDSGNEIKIPLTPEERQIAIDTYAKYKTPFEFKSLAKAIDKKTTFNYRDYQSMSPMKTTAILSNIFGRDRSHWIKAFDAMIFFDDNDRLNVFLDKHFPDLDGKLRKAFIKARLTDGYAEYSLYAIKRILRFLERGYELSQARIYAKLPDIIPEYDIHEEDILKDMKDVLDVYQRDKDLIAKNKKEGFYSRLNPLLDRYRDKLHDKWGVNSEDFEKLYLTSGEAYDIDKSGITLPKVELGMIRNPVAQRSMTVLRRLVNHLMRQGDINKYTTINIELARSVNDLATRNAWTEYQKSNERKRQEATSMIEEYNMIATDELILRCILYKEQGERCLYTGKFIEITDVLEVGGRFDIEHTIPRSMSGNDSQANKTLCQLHYNREVKKGRIPTECPNYEENQGYDVAIASVIQKWEEKLTALEKNYQNQAKKARGVTDPSAHVVARTKAIVTRFERDYWREKIKTFTYTREELNAREDGFMKRQLVDTGVMTRHAVDFLRSVYRKVYPVNGQAVSFARKAWGVQGNEKKSREEHTHHAVDAMVIAYLSRDRFNQICSLLKDDGKTYHQRIVDITPPPFDDFAHIVKEETDEILIRNLYKNNATKPTNRETVYLAKPHHTKDGIIRKVKGKGSDTVRGQLVKETFYGAIKLPRTDERIYVVRKPLNGFKKPSEIDKIVDPIVREKVKNQHANYIALGEKRPFDQLYWMKEPSIEDNFAGIPIKKVRIKTRLSEPSQLKNHDFSGREDYKTPYYVESGTGSNFRAALYETIITKGKKAGEKKWICNVENLLEWAQTHRKDDYVEPRDRTDIGTFIGYISPGKMALIYGETPDELKNLSSKELNKRLYTIRRIAKDQRIILMFHTEARAVTDLSKVLGDMKKNASGESKVSISTPHELLLLRPIGYQNNLLFEDIHFKLSLDGKINFLF